MCNVTRELHCRVNDGIQVRLLWHQDDGQLSVDVKDTKAASEFSVEIRDAARALDVFHHPFAYA